MQVIILVLWLAFVALDVVAYQHAPTPGRRKWYYQCIPGGGYAALLLEK